MWLLVDDKVIDLRLIFSYTGMHVPSAILWKHTGSIYSVDSDRPSISSSGISLDDYLFTVVSV